MDPDVLKGLLAVAAGVLALAGGAFTFVNGRLSEATTSEARRRVYDLALQWISFALNLIGILSILFIPGYTVAIVFFAAAFVVQITLFMRREEPIRRIDIVTFTLMCSAFAFFLASVGTLYWVGRLVDILSKTVK